MANITTQTIRVDLSTDKVIPSAFTHQNDTARTLVFDMYNGGMPYTMTGNTVKFAYKSPIVNGQYSVIAGASMASGTVSGNKVSVTLPSEYTAISGVGMLTMVITPTSGTVRPVNIKFVVQSSADGDDVVLGASDWPAGLYEYMDDWLAENEPTEIANLKSDLDLYNKGLLDCSPIWEIGGLGTSGKYSNNNNSRSTDLQLLPAGTYVVDSGSYLSYVISFTSDSYDGGAIIWWGQSGKNTFTLLEPAYIGFMINTTPISPANISIYTNMRQTQELNAVEPYRLMMDGITKEVSPNVLDKTMCMGNTGIDSSGKSVTNNNSWCTNDFDVSEGGYVCSDKKIYKIAFYNSSKAYISSAYPDRGYVAIPNNAVYARCVFTYEVAGFTDAFIQVNTSNELSYFCVLDAKLVNVKNLSILQESIKDGSEMFAEKNLVWEQGVTAGDTGADYPYSYGIRTNYFAGCNLIISVNSGFRIKIYQYTANKAGVSQILTWASGEHTYGVSLPIGYLYRLVFARETETETLTPNDVESCGKVYCSNYPAKMINAGIEEKTLRGMTQAMATASSMTFIGDKLYVFRYTSAIDVGVSVNGDIYDITQGGYISWREPNAFIFNMGHANTVDYSEENDCLLVGNGAGTDSQLPNKIYIFKNAKNKSAFLISDSDCLTIDVSSGDWGKQLNCVWGEDNNRQYNIIYCLTNYEEGNMDNYAVGNPNNFVGESKSFIRRVLLGKGQHDLGSGTFNSNVSDDEFNGTYKVLDVIERPFDNNEYCNDCDYYGNAIYENLSGRFDGVPCSIHEFDEFGKAVNTRRVIYPMYDESGNVISAEPQGMAVRDAIRYCFYNGNIMSFRI